MLWDLQRLADDGCPHADEGPWRVLTADEFPHLKRRQRIRCYSVYGGPATEYVIRGSPFWSEWLKCWFVQVEDWLGPLSLLKSSRLIEVWCGDESRSDAA